jgi:hypothetical protein
MKKEIWKDIPGYEGHYQVSNFGNVKSIKFGKERILKQYLDNHGYYNISLQLSSNKRKRYLIHQLVAMAFHNWDKNTHPVIRHLNHDKKDNRFENLQPGTVRENSSDYRDNLGTSFVRGKYLSQIGYGDRVNRRNIFLGYFNTQEEASDMYQKALANIHLYNGDNKAFRLALATVTL